MLNSQRIQYAAAANTGGTWEILGQFGPMADYSGANTNSAFAWVGSSSFKTATESNTGASSRTSGVGLYSAFFNKVGVTKVALCGTDWNGVDPTSSSRYIIADLVATTTKTFYDTLNDLDTALQNNTLGNIAGTYGDSNFGTDSIDNFVAGTAKSGSVTSTSGGLTDTDGNTVTSFCMWGINRDSDNDTQALCFYSGNLQSGKQDAWRGSSTTQPKETIFSFWGDDFHTDSSTQRIGNQRQTYPGYNGSGWQTTQVNLLAY